MRAFSRRLLSLPLLALPVFAAEEPMMLDPVEVHGTLPYDLRLTRTVTVTSYTGILLENTGITTYADLAPLVPGLFVSEQSVANSSFNLRGINTDNGDPRGSQRVSVFQDGVLLSNNAARNVALFDLERVDVLKGPQAASFGRDSQIGAINTVTRKAADTASSELSAGFGNNHARSASGHVNLPVIDGKLFARAAFSFEQADGYVNNRADDSDLQGRDTAAFRASLRWQPSAETTADFIFNYQRDTPPGIAFKNMSPVLTDGDPFTAANLNRGRALGAERDIVGLTGILTHTLNESWSVTSTTGWRDTDASEEFDADGSPLFLLEAGEYTRSRQFSQDFRFDYDSGDRLTASLGAGVFWEKASQTLPFRTNQQQLYAVFASINPLLPPPPAFPFPLLPTLYEEEFTNSAENLSGDVFGKIDYKLTRRLTLGGNLRLTHEDRTSGYKSLPTTTPNLVSFPFLPSTAGGGNSFFAPTGGTLEASRSEIGVSGGLNATYALTPRHSAYASVARGRRPATTTFSQAAPFNTIDRKEETVWHYELGLKGSTANRRISYGIAAFLYDYNNFQTEQIVAPPPAPTVDVDAGRARGQGFETTLQGVVNDHLTLFGAYGFTDTEFASRDEDSQPQAFAGNSFRLTARHVVSVGATLSFPVDDIGTFFVTPTYEYKSKHFFEDDNQKSGGSLVQDGFGLLHLRLGYRTPDNRWEVVLWARNLLDKEYLIDAGNIGADFGFPTTVRGAPRMIGMNVTARF
jgi:iron complex outermembrane recepter protein